MSYDSKRVFYYIEDESTNIEEVQQMSYQEVMALKKVRGR
jgi:hypothetical protein